MSLAPLPAVPGTVNLRDVGGLAAGSGRVRPGILYRSGHLARVDAAGVEALQRLGVGRIVDLRDDAEVSGQPSPAALRAVTVRVPMFAGSAESFVEQDWTLSRLYRSMLDECAPRLVEAVRALAVGQPALVHCTAGKDRTGVTIALALAAAGVDDEAIVDDYARSEGLLPARRNERVLAYLRSAYPQGRHLEELAVHSPAPVMRGLLADLRERFGGAGEYLRSHGLTAPECAALRGILVVEDAGV